MDGTLVLHVLLDLLGLLLEGVEVPFRGLAVGEGFDEGRHRHGCLFFLGGAAILAAGGEDAWDEAALGECVLLGFVVDDDGVDGEVGADVPHLGRILAAVGEVAEDEVVELVEEDAADLCIRHAAEELRVPVEGDVIVFRIECDACRGEVHGGDLTDVAGHLREEGGVLEEREEVAVQVVVGIAMAEHSLILPRWC